MEWVWFSELRCSPLFRAMLVLSLSETSRSCSSNLSQMPLYFVFYLLVWSLPARDLSGYTPKGDRLSWSISQVHRGDGKQVITVEELSNFRVILA